MDHSHHGNHNQHASHSMHDKVLKNDNAEGHQMHDKHAGHHTEDFLKRFMICLALTIPLLLLSDMIQHWVGIDISFRYDNYALLLLGSVIYFYGGMPFLKGMISEIRNNAIGMMTLVAVAITVSFIYSVAVALGYPGMDFFWELATLIDIMLLGHWLEMKSVMAASKSLESLVALMPSIVHVERDEVESDVELVDLKEDDIVIVKPGEKVPADGLVTEGQSFVNESMLTGESVPVKKQTSDKVIAGAVNGDGYFKFRVTASGEKSYLNKVIALVESAQKSKSKTQNLADKVAKWLTVVSIVTGIITFAWFMQFGMAMALERMVTVMVTACPHALGIAIPLVVALSTSVSATNGLLIRNRTAFENARKITVVVFDKTGTLTKGSHEIKDVISLNESISSDEMLMYAAALQQHSEHYIAKGVLNELRNRKLTLWKSNAFTYMQGMGVSGEVNGRKVIAAGPNYFKSVNKALPAISSSVNTDSETVNYILIDDAVAGYITLSDSLRESSAAAIDTLKSMNIRSFLLTGDNEGIASAVASKLGIDGFMANVLPHQKLEKVKELQRKGEVVAMTGDGVNDAPALAQADVGIAIGSGTDVAAETADIILVNSDPADVVKVIGFGKATYSKMIQNLFWAAGYNIIAIPLAAGVLYPEFVLSPAMGAVLMSLSTIIVAVNARLLKLEKE